MCAAYDHLGVDAAMGSKSPAPVVVPDTSAATAAALPPPAMQPNPQSSGVKKDAAAVAGGGMNATILTSPRGLTQPVETARKSLLGI